MGTSFETVYDRAITTVKDYKLDQLAQSDYQSFLLYWQSILELAVPEFTGCLTSLDYDVATQTFAETLSTQEVNIVAKMMVAGWFASELQDVTQFKLHLQNREYKTHAEGQNLKERSEYLDRLREKYTQDITNYQLSNLSKLPYFGTGT